MQNERKSLLREHWRAGLVALASLLWAAITIFHFQNTLLDDAHITFRYARAVASGFGFQYNPPEAVLGTSTPLFTLLLAMLAVLKVDIPLASLWLNIVSLAALATTIYLLTAGVIRPSIGLVAAISVLLVAGNYMLLGMETLTYSLLILLALYACYHDRYTQAAFFSGLATLMRYDGCVLAGVVFLAFLVKQRRLPWVPLAVYAATVVPWLLYATWAFGNPLPNTFFAKTGAGQAGNAFLMGLPDAFATLYLYRPFAYVHPILWLVFLCPLALGAGKALTDRKLWPFAAWVLIYLCAYTLLRLRAAYEWYYYPVIPIASFLVALGIDTLLQWFKNARKDVSPNTTWLLTRALWVSIGLPILVAFGLGFFIYWNVAPNEIGHGARYRIYKEAAEALCEVSEPDDSVAIPEIGIVGWLCPRRIIDPYGLVTPQMVPYIVKGERLAGVVMLDPDFIVITNHSRDQSEPAFPYPNDFRHPYRLVEAITHNDFPYTIAIYQKNP